MSKKKRENSQGGDSNVPPLNPNKNDGSMDIDAVSHDEMDKILSEKPGETAGAKDPEKKDDPSKQAECGKSDEELRKAAGERDEFYDLLLRTRAEFDNYKKRMARQFEEIVKNANEELLLKMLELADNFGRALEAAKKSSEFENLYKGTELIYHQLSDVLRKAGVEAINAVGEKFDPNWHDAVMQMGSEDVPDGIVMQEVLRGYKLYGKALRHAKVVVSKGRAEEEETTSAD